ncbi:MFS transporter [Ammoniphilus sp. YIM 78166]|uniref:MFS transporter n=1 Tax=Ammoniphilus sp. YIM 78166 TaxID=1644106 RepID=UPI001070449A|nr:MFS transporter [Ammoniphilus sp. YIM 78166]
MIVRSIVLFSLFQISVKGNLVIATLYAVHLAASPMELGFIMASTALFPMMFAVYAGRASDSLGYRLPLLLGLLASTVALLLPYVFEGRLLVIVASQCLFGLGHIFTLLTTQNLIGALSDTETRSKHIGTLSLGIALANTMGPFVTGYAIEFIGFEKTYLLLSILALSPGLYVWLRPFHVTAKGVGKKQENHKVKDLLSSRSLRNTLITSGIILTGIGIYDFYFPIYGKSIGLSASTIGLILSLNSLAYFVVRLLYPWLNQRYSIENILVACLLISSIGFILLPLFQHWIVLALMSFIIGLGLGCGQPLSIVLAYNQSPQGRTGEVLGIRLTINKVVQFCVPILFGSIGSVVGFIPIYWSSALLLGLSGFSNFRRTQQMDEEQVQRSQNMN